MIRPEFVPGIDATVDETPPAWQDSGVAESPGQVREIAWGHERVELEVDASRAALLVLNDSFFPGWEARVDGSAVKIHRTNSLVRGVFLDPGHHRVEFAYRPKSFVIGVSISIATLTAAVAIGWLSRSIRKPPVGESRGLDAA
jgi:uncharacterized membrane protein YfhO